MARATKDEIAAEVIHGYFIAAADAKAEREEILKSSYRSVDPNYVPDDVGAPKVKSGYLWSVKNTKLSWLIRSLKANGVYARAEPLPEYADDGVTVTKAIQAQFTHREFGNEKTLISGLDQMFPFGDHYWVPRWQEDSAGNFGIKFINVNIFDVFPDPWDNRFVIFRRFVTLKELERMVSALSAQVYEEVLDPETGQIQTIPAVDEKGKPVLADGGVALRALKKIEREVRKGKIHTRYGWHYTSHANTMKSETGRVSGSDDFAGMDHVRPEDDPANVRVAILEFHELGPDGVTAKVIPDNPTDKGSEDLWLQKFTPHPYGRAQLVRVSPYPCYDEAYSYTLEEIAGGKQKLHDFALRASARRTQRYADPAIKHRRQSKIKPIYLRSQSNIAIPVQNMDDIEYMDPPAGGDMHYMLHLLTKQTMDTTLGESELRRGNVAGASSATEAAIAEQGGSTSDFLVATRVFMAIEDLADLTLRILRHHVKGRPELLVPYLGERSVEMLRLTPEILNRQYWVRIGGTVMGANSQARTQNLLNIATQLAPAGVIDLNAVADHALSEAGFNSDRFLMQKKGPPPVPPHVEHVQLRYRQRIRVSPQDDHQQHIAAHVGEWGVMRQNPAADPMMAEELFKHIIEHQSYLMMQQQAQMAGPQQGGAQPFQPSQAGAPGQPGVFNARTANVNQQRQAPNNGNAPQPAIAPGRVGVMRGGSN